MNDFDASFDNAIKFFCRRFGVPSLYREQEQYIQEFFSKKNVFFCAPAGFGKSLLSFNAIFLY